MGAQNPSLNQFNPGSGPNVTTYGAVVRPPGVSTVVMPWMAGINDYRVLSADGDTWYIEYRSRAEPSHLWYRVNCSQFDNPQSAWVWLEETGRI